MYNNYLRNCYFYPIIWGWETLVILMQYSKLLVIITKKEKSLVNLMELLLERNCRSIVNVLCDTLKK